MSRTILSGLTSPAGDARDFVAEASAHPLFDPGGEIVIARAPGRLDLMGGIADYSGSLVLQWPLHEATLVAAQVAPEGLRVVSLGPAADGARSFAAPLADLFPNGAPLSYENARRWFAVRPDDAWAAYVIGALIVLAHEKGIAPPSGLRLLVRSTVPEGKGVSSSAALEVATMTAIATAIGITIPARDLALLAQIVENRVVGAACGVMDQMTASCGVSGQLMALLCQPAELRGTIPIPDDLEIWGVDSGVRHAVSGADYTSVRIAAFMGARILAERASLRVEPGSRPGKVVVDDTRWGGHLANVTPSELDGGPLGSLPESMRGSVFLQEYAGITDLVTSVDSECDYAVRACAAHPVHEHFRVRAFAGLLQAPASEERAELLGELMYQSHASYSACGLGTEATDLLVTLVRGAGRSRGFFGSKITGGGSGGTVAVLGRRGSDIMEIARAYEARTGHRPHVFSGSSPGAATFGTIVLGPA